MTIPPVIVWFRQDLRLADNPALAEACREGRPVVPVYILDDINAGVWKIGGASRWWLHRSLGALNDKLGGRLILRAGDARQIIPQLARETGATAIYWNRCYEPWRIARDKLIKQDLQETGIEAKSFNAALLWEPWDVRKDDGTPYRVFTPFYRKGCLAGRGEPPAPLPAPRAIAFGGGGACRAGLDDLRLLPRVNWHGTMDKLWTPGEAGAQQRLKSFLSEGLKGYKEGRNHPHMPHVSRLSPHLHFGEISPRQVWHDARAAGAALGCETDLDHFCSELGWREFSHSLLYDNPDLPESPLQARFRAFAWDENPAALSAWQRGETGYPIVDAGLRELWATGYMHNRVRMIVGSFLIKDLLLHWTEGEKWFWDTLVDADLANNSASWQWVAGCGADAAPYFRIFNPVTQGMKFDPDGIYVKQWLPELAALPAKAVHAPWEAGGARGYPPPLVDHKQARENALVRFKELGEARSNAA